MKAATCPSILLAILIFVGGHAFAQADDIDSKNPNFSGTWNLIFKKSDAIQDQTMWIVHVGDQLKLKRTPAVNDTLGAYGTTDLTLFTDGRGEQNNLRRGRDENAPIRSITKWDGAKIVRKYKVTASMLIREAVGSDELEVIESYSLSKDGQTLTIETVTIRNQASFSQFPKSTDRSRSSFERTYRKA